MSSKIPRFVPPSPYVPLLRRFTDERAVELNDTKRLYDGVYRRFKRSPWSADDAPAKLAERILDSVNDTCGIPTLPGDYLEQLVGCLLQLLRCETAIFDFPEPQWSSLTLKEHVELRRHLRAQEHFLDNQQAVIELLCSTMTDIIGGLAWVPNPPAEGPPIATIPLYATVDVHDITDRIIGTCSRARHADFGLFSAINERLYLNICAASKIDPSNPQNKPFVTAADSPLSAEKIIETYLFETPFRDVLATAVPFSIPRQAYQEHGAIFAPSGSGKTQLIQHLVTRFLEDEDPPAMFIIDGMGTMLEKIAQLEVFQTRLKDKIVILDPKDLPGLNFFDMKGGSEAQQMELFTYLFTAFDHALSTKMSTAVHFIVKLLRSIPGADLRLMLDLMSDTSKEPKQSPFFSHITKLDDIAQTFFRQQFFGPNFKPTKEAIQSRLLTALDNETFRAMFTAPRNTFDACRCIEDKNIVLVNTDRVFLGDDGSAVFGRFIIAQCLAAALARASIPADQRHLALLIVDEAKDYFDAKTEKILSDARQFGLGLLFATQFVEQLPEGVRKAMYNNTSIKIAGPITYSEAVTFARETHTTPQFIRESKKRDNHSAEFAVYVRNHTPSAVRLTIPFGTLENEPRMDLDAYRALRERNRARFAPSATPPPLPPATAPPSDQPPQPKPSMKWQTPE